MVLRSVQDQVNLLADHMRQEDPNPDFILLHASMIMDLARCLPFENLPEYAAPVEFQRSFPRDIA